MSDQIDRRDCLVGAGALTMSLALTGRALGATAEAPKSDDALKFLCVGDWGERGSEPQRAVAAAMGAAADDFAPSFVVSLGDNFYNSGVDSVTDSHWQSSFENVYTAPNLQCPWYPVLGNHDRKGKAMAQVAYSQISNRWRMPGPFYMRTERLQSGATIDFFFLDTELIISQHSGIHRFVPGTKADDQIEWLDAALAAGSANWKIVIGHHPIASGGPHGGTDEMMGIIRPLLISHRVAAYLSGHDHNMQHLVSDGIHYVVCGCGATTKPARVLPETIFASESLGFLRAAISQHSIEFSFIDAHGQTLNSAVLTGAA